MLSICVAITGIATPIGLSFILQKLVSASSLQAFAAGAALSATSLGTTFRILSTTNLVSTRLGAVITIAAMLDDIIGLVMVQIISNLGGGSSFSATTVVRPIFVSIGFVVGIILLCTFLLKPILKKIIDAKDKMPNFLSTMQSAFILHTFLLIGTVAGATYAGTSSLFAAYLAGVIVSWVDDVFTDSKVSSGSRDPAISHLEGEKREDVDGQTDNNTSPATSSMGQINTSVDILPTGKNVYGEYYEQPVNRILAPFFFVSVPSVHCVLTF